MAIRLLQSYSEQLETGSMNVERRASNVEGAQKSTIPLQTGVEMLKVRGTNVESTRLRFVSGHR